MDQNDGARRRQSRSLLATAFMTSVINTGAVTSFPLRAPVEKTGLVFARLLARVGVGEMTRPKPFLTINFATSDRVALGRYRPRAPTDPYVPTLEHTVPLIMVSLRAGDSNGRYAREQAGIDQG